MSTCGRNHYIDVSVLYSKQHKTVHHSLLYACTVLPVGEQSAGGAIAAGVVVGVVVLILLVTVAVVIAVLLTRNHNKQSVNLNRKYWNLVKNVGNLT